MPRSEHLFWGGLAAVATAYELQALRTCPDRTLSKITRATFRTHTRAGRLTFTFAWGGLTAWYAHHILATTPQVGSAR